MIWMELFLKFYLMFRFSRAWSLDLLNSMQARYLYCHRLAPNGRNLDNS